MSDHQLDRVRRAFDAAMTRLLAPETYEGSDQDELSNALHHLYRLGELASERDPSLQDQTVAAQAPGALGAQWIRGYDTHQVMQLTVNGQTYPKTYPVSYNFTWLPLSSMPFIAPDKKERWRDYDAHLAGAGVEGTLRSSFEGLVALVLPPAP